MHYTKEKSTFFNVKICALDQNILEFPIIFDYFNKNDVTVIVNEVVYPLNNALWNNKSSKIKEIVDFLTNHTPFFPKSNSGYSNVRAWNELIKMINDYYLDALNFESTMLIKKSTEIDTINLVQKRLKSFFANVNDLNYFMSVIEIYSNTERERLFNFFLIAPYERIIGEIEIRDNSEVKNIFDNVIRYFVWQ